MKTKLWSLQLIALVGLFFIAASSLAGASLDQPGERIERAVLGTGSDHTEEEWREKWAAVLREFGAANSSDSNPVIRAIKGHACLALNRNNESLTLFLSLLKQPDKDAWKEWATGFAKRHDRSAVAQYLKADALARLGLWREAVGANTDSLQLNPRFPLALSARGVAYAKLGALETARKDLEAACTAGPFLADAWANLATVKYMKRAPRGALEGFQQALHVNSDFALARNGEACTYFVSGDWSAATELLESLTHIPAVAGLAFYNLNAILREDLELTKQALEEDKLGSFLDVTRQVAQLDSHIAHNDRVLRVTQFDPTGFTGNLRDEALRNRTEQLAERSRLLTSIGQAPGTRMGGVSTREIREAFKRMVINREKLPVSTWFGLAQDISL